MNKFLNGIGLGTFPFANPFTPVSESKAQSIVDMFFRHGGKYIDTAPTYSFGGVETFLGKVLKKYSRDRFFITSACGYIKDNEGKYILSGKYNDVIQDCKDSLHRLQLDYLDLYINHFPDTNTPTDETMSALKDLKKQGLIKRIGVSNVDTDLLKKYNNNGDVEFVVNRFSLLNQNLSRQFFNYCEINNIKIVAYQVIERGLLTEKSLRDLELKGNDLRLKKPEFEKSVTEVIGGWVKEYLLPLADELDTSITSLAVWWVWQQPALAMCQLGTTSPTQIYRNLQVQNFTPPSDTLDRINIAYQTLENYTQKNYSKSVREFMGLTDMYKNLSASGK